MSHRPELTGRYTITVEEAAEVLGVSRNSAYQAAADGTLPVIRVGRRILVLVGPLEGMLGVTTPRHSEGPGNVTSLATVRRIA
jgi:excisionase family DNA binding protein